jgi:cation diffusion facilitator family transporter
MKPPKNKYHVAYILVWISIILNILVFGIKYYAGLRIGSLAMIADAWHSLSDSITSVVVLIGFWIASKPADYEHPFGHGRAESVISVIVATILAVVGVNFISESISRLQTRELVDYDITSLIIFSVTILIKEIMAQYSIYYGKKIQSESLRADGWHHRTDAISTVVIVIGAFFGEQFYWMDSVLAMGVSLMLFYVTYEILKSAASSILGETPSHEFKLKVMKIAKDVNPAITSVHHFRIHSYGDHKELNIDIRLPAEMSVHDAHVIASAVEKSIYFIMNYKTTVHVEPGLYSEYLRNSNYF